MMGLTELRQSGTVLEAVRRVRSRLQGAGHGEYEFAEDDADVRLLLQRLERVQRLAGSPRSVSLSPFLASAMQLH